MPKDKIRYVALRSDAAIIRKEASRAWERAYAWAIARMPHVRVEMWVNDVYRECTSLTDGEGNLELRLID